MLEDFRQELYQKYVSAFREDSATMSDAEWRAYQTWCEHKYLPLLKNLGKEAKILEIGCGDGKLLAVLRKHGYEETIGIDVSGEQIQLAKAKGLNVRQADAFEFLSQFESAFEAIIAIDTIEHFTKSEVLKLLSGIKRSLKNDGILLLQTPNGEGLFAGQIIYGDLTHLCIFTEKSLRQALLLHGFVDIKCYETSPLSVGVGGKIRVAIWSLIKSALNLVRLIEGGRGKMSQYWTENIIVTCRKP